jgi:hypothetical protein
MLTKNYIESRQEKLYDFSELSKDFFNDENMKTKLKKRKSKIFLIMSNRRKQHMAPDSQNINLNLNNTANFLKIFNLIKNKEEKTDLLNNLFLNNITHAKQILSKYQKALNLIIDYNFLSTSNFFLDIIEKNDEIIELIIQKKENINYLIKIMNSIANENSVYDYNYIMITSNLLIYDKNVDNLLKKEIDHSKIIQLIIKNETNISYSYLFYIYAYLYHFDDKQIEAFENILDSLILLLFNQNNNNVHNLLEDIYDIFVLFSNAPKFIQKFFDNYNIIVGNCKYNNNDLLIEQKLSIVSNLYKISNSQQIKDFMEKDNGNIINQIESSLQILLDIIHTNNNNIKTNLNLLLLNFKILLTITYHKDLTDLLLDNKVFFSTLINIFTNIISAKEIKNNNDSNNDVLNSIYNIVLKIINNIINNEQKLFISQIISNNLHLAIKEKFYNYINCNCINEEHFISLINIIGSLYDYQKKDKLKTELIKLDLDNNKFHDIIIGIIKKYGENKNINYKCTNFLEIYYPTEPKENFLQLSNFNFLNLNLNL